MKRRAPPALDAPTSAFAPDVRALAGVIRTAQDAARQIEPLTSRTANFDVASAYEVARLVHEDRVAAGANPIGRKIGFSNPEMWARYGVRAPIWGYVYDATVDRVAGSRAACRMGRWVEPLIEPEIVLHFREAPPAGAAPPEVLASIDWIAHGFEIVQSHFPEWRFGAADAIAAGALHAKLFVGEPQPVDRLGPDPLASLASFSLALIRNGQACAAGQGSNVLGSPLAAAAHLVALLAMQPGSEPLRAGEIVTTGTITAAQPVRAGETWRSEIIGIALPGLTLEIDP